MMDCQIREKLLVQDRTKSKRLKTRNKLKMILKKFVKLRSHAKYKRRQSKVILNNSEGTNGNSLKKLSF